MEWVIASLAVLAILGFFMLASNSKKKNNLENKIISDFDIMNGSIIIKISAATNNITGAAFDHDRRIFYTIKNYVIKSYKYTDILSVELIVDGRQLTKISRSDQITSAAIGALLAGGAGAIIGGLGASREASVSVSGVYVKFLINSLDSPVHFVDFIEMTATGNTNGALAVQSAQSLIDLTKVIIHQNETGV